VKVERGWVAPELREEFPELGLWHARVAARDGRTPAAVRERLRRMSDRFTGARAVSLRQEAVPWAYRVFFRQIGIDPDETRTPVERAALDRMMHGGFRSRGLVADATLMATVETAVPVMALDHARVAGDPGLRTSGRGDRLPGAEFPLPSGRIVVADEREPIAVLFEEPPPDRAVRAQTERVLLVAVQVKGVPDLVVEEALWSAAEVLRAEP
jgi:DNA/RNA-binding domain of Phe-tRNA-synthetase-like protein